MHRLLSFRSSTHAAMKYSLTSIKNYLRVSYFKSQLRCVSNQAQKPQVQLPSLYEKSNSKAKGRSNKKIPILPELPRNKIEELQDVTSVSIVLNHVSWAKISIPDLRVLNWDAYTLPGSSVDMLETDVLETALIIKEKIPSSDLYVMESRPFRRTPMLYPYSVCLRSMLILLLSSINDGLKDTKIVFQKSSVLNSLFSLSIGGERTSAKKVLEKKGILKTSVKLTSLELRNNLPNWLSNIIVRHDHLNSFSSYGKEKQESLSIALLIALAFLDIGVFQNPHSISVIQKRRPPIIIQDSNFHL